MRLPVKALFGRIDGDSVEDVITLAAYGWFAVALLQLVTVAFAVAGGELSGGDAVDPIVSLLGGWFLLKTRSRGVAGALLLYGGVMLLLCLLKLAGATGSGVPFLTAAVGVWAGWRGFAGAQFWQTRACAIVDWKQVAAGAGVAVAITIGAVVVLKAGLSGVTLPVTLAEFLLTAVLFLVPVAALIWFTRRRRFAHNDPACPWPPKK
jgi:hypothetical protein